MTNAERIAAYYVRLSRHMAADLLDFYTRAERGRRIQAQLYAPKVKAGNVTRLRRKA